MRKTKLFAATLALTAAGMLGAGTAASASAADYVFIRTFDSTTNIQDNYRQCMAYGAAAQRAHGWKAYACEDGVRYAQNLYALI